MLDYKVALARARIAGNIVTAIAKNVGSAAFDAAKAKADVAKTMALCFKNGHSYTFHSTDEYMGKGKDNLVEPIYWRICEKCKASQPGKVIASPTSLKSWLAIHSNERQEVEEKDLPDYAEKSKARK